MDTLIQFIVKNLFIVIVIVGFIVSLLNKARKGGASGSENRMPSFGGSTVLSKARPQQQRQPMPARQPDAAGATRNEAPAPPRSMPASSAPAAAQRASFGESTPEGDRRVRDGMQAPLPDRESVSGFAGLRRDTAVPAAAERRLFRTPEGDELRRAFVLAEVLGPPRAKRPFRKP